MAYQFDPARIFVGDAAIVEYAGSSSRRISGNVAGIFGGALNVQYIERGRRRVVQVVARSIANGAIRFAWIDRAGIRRQYPQDDLLYDDGSGDSGGGDGIEEAPKDNRVYARKSGAWVEITEQPSDVDIGGLWDAVETKADFETYISFSETEPDPAKTVLWAPSA